MRGDLASRPIADVMREAERLAKAGVKELLVISQDTSAYGVDLRHAEGEFRGRARTRRASKGSRRRSASSGSGFDCTTSIRIRTSTA